MSGTCGTTAIDAGAPVSAVKEILAQADMRTTMRYVQATEEGKRKAVEAAVHWGRKEKSATKQKGSRLRLPLSH
jgi:hypothetical protein